MTHSSEPPGSMLTFINSIQPPSTRWASSLVSLRRVMSHSWAIAACDTRTTPPSPTFDQRARRIAPQERCESTSLRAHLMASGVKHTVSWDAGEFEANSVIDSILRHPRGLTPQRMSRLVCVRLDHITRPWGMPAPPPSPALQYQFGTRIRELRVAMGMSQEAFADRCGFARTYMSRIETGGANPSINAIKVLADALGVSISALFEGM
ncbi:helix-turn-helix transcriptional regulator [Pseudomonas sp. BR1R-5]|uniref:helix-turn-helix domain-containing protein n=2 Tax=Pseudomonas TaxID=286 RepID=UPI002852B6A3|nr:helix-turn-helix transcriptional regulator [Pseudomonas sp. BR1R-5]